MSLFQIPQGDQIFCDATSEFAFRHFDRPRKHTFSDSFMVCQELINVVFQNQFGMYLGPVVGCADKGQNKLGVLQRLPIQHTPEGM
jgi:hypothetical protein